MQKKMKKNLSDNVGPQSWHEENGEGLSYSQNDIICGQQLQAALFLTNSQDATAGAKHMNTQWPDPLH